MCYPDRDYYITLFFQLLEEFEAAPPLNRTERRGAPQIHPACSLIVFFAIMILKQIHRFKAQHRWLLTHPDWVSPLHFDTCPSRVTLSRRYKQLGPRLEAFVAYLGDVGVDIEPPPDSVYQDKSLYKAKGSVWHQKDRNANIIPDGLVNLDTDASWSTSKYRGRVWTSPNNHRKRVSTFGCGLYRLSQRESGACPQNRGTACPQYPVCDR